ncbi:hypothetical protein TVAG_471130 [Trichomonas vaginalis G3]|uniref:Uncharacterized protein n=1 Tax=Trichomonas vaginalis (strain ATCC PRA-98 / G3) TaxID=412133 RepID=A2G798_TRIV3|nr:hypothetical protein TVAGG3_0510470 [Trichomonas vaginalis G3]EAX86969.1 hypothetical protein TVAG_471130 [Trichomonas vaginalis G3]KAI5517750.1 hypothetical protein TVAGG3_0510470 [Trichomonas vaginalis G3]|eukprot:XP_001299899.1 hypothetical protein [Trichomonas vaginalis G3]
MNFQRSILTPRFIKERKRTTAQSIRDNEKVMRRIENAGAKLQYVANYLVGIFGQNVAVYSLLTHANRLSEHLNIPLDRLATRNRQALFCWFTENWEIIQHYLPCGAAEPQNLKYVQPKIYDMHQGPNEVDITDIRMLLNYH